MSLSHFSTPGVGVATSADRAGLAAHPPARGSAQLEAASAEPMRGERASMESGNPASPSLDAEIAAVQNAYYDTVLRQHLQDAESNPDLAAAATAVALAWSQARELMGDVDNPRIEEIKARMERIWKNAMTKMWTRCTNHDLAAVTSLIGLARQAVIIGWSWWEEAQDKAERCANVEVRFDSLVTGTLNAPGQTQSHTMSGRWRVASTTPVSWTGLGEGPLGHTAFSYSYRIDYQAFENQCVDPNHYTLTTGTATTPGRLLALVQVNPNPRVLEPGSPPPPVAKILLHPGYSLSVPSARPTETHRGESFNCSPSSETTTQSGWLERHLRQRQHHR